MMRLWYHPESDSLFWAGELGGDADSALCEDVTDNPRFRNAAIERGVKTPPDAHIGMASDDFPQFVKATNIAEAVVKSMKAWGRKEADFYPTPVDATESLIPMLKFLDVKTIWEPACGDGRLSRVLEHHGFDVISSDLRPHSGYGTGGVDFLGPDRHTEGVDMIVTNPPFAHAEAFIRRALEYTPNVAMLVKGTYWHAGGRLKLFEECRPSFMLPLTWRPAFLEVERGKNPIMEVGWVVWTDQETGYGLDGNACIYEPIRKRFYPGYGGVGILEAMDILEGELAALSGNMASYRPLPLAGPEVVSSSAADDI